MFFSYPRNIATIQRQEIGKQPQRFRFHCPSIFYDYICHRKKTENSQPNNKQPMKKNGLNMVEEKINNIDRIASINTAKKKKAKKRALKRFEKQLDCLCPIKKKKVLRLSQSMKEAQARRKEAKHWQSVTSTMRYKKATTKASSRKVTRMVIDDVFEGILLNLHPKNQDKSMAVQMRILRRIVEKRQAQTTHRLMGRSRGLLTHHTAEVCICQSMNDIRTYQMCM